MDSLLFPTIAFGTLMPQIVAAQFVAKVAGGAVWSWLLDREQDHREKSMSELTTLIVPSRGHGTPFAALCACGLRYGAHRVKDYACPNQRWRPGNGEAQWLSAVFKRAGT